MATSKIKNQMDGFMQPASDDAPTMGLYDTNTPQSVREGTPLRLFDKTRARYKKGDIVEENYNRALAVYSAMKNDNQPDAKIKAQIGELQFNKIIMNKANVKKAATGGLMGGDPRLGKVEDVGYQAYAEGGEVEDEGMKIPELEPQAEISMEMQMEDAMPENNDMDEDTVLDTSMLDEEEKVQLNEAVEMHPELESIIPKIVATEFTGEGEVDGPGTGTSDSVPAMLSDGEFVFTAKATKQLGVDKLRKMMKSAEAEYDNSMAVQDSQMESGQPMMANGGLLSANKYNI
jgi:hypothetical protein